ncbi:MAG: DUF2344 domain-containing protein [Selenomonadaceae bacterium]
MSNFRLEITKGEEIRYISHLDYASLMERAVRRAKLPVAYSEVGSVRHLSAYLNRHLLLHCKPSSPAYN